MKLLTPQKQVNFHGISLMVPEWAEYIAADSDGRVYAYDMDPQIELVKSWQFWSINDNCINFDEISIVDLEGMPWTETKVKI